jgi:hypothetical protein
MTPTTDEVTQRLTSCPMGEEDSELLWLVFGVLPGVRFGQIVLSKASNPSATVGIEDFVVWDGKWWSANGCFESKKAMRQATVQKLAAHIAKWELKVRVGALVPEKTHQEHLDNIRELILPQAPEKFHPWLRDWQVWVDSCLQADHLQSALPGVAGVPASSTKSLRL